MKVTELRLMLGVRVRVKVLPRFRPWGSKLELRV